MSQQFKLYGGWIIPIALACLIAVQNFRFASAGGDDLDASLARLRAVHQLIRDRYVRPVSSEEIVEGALHGMMGALDSHCAYFNAKEFQDFLVDTKGEFSGVGVEIGLKDGYLHVITPLEDSPAARADIRAGDVILKIDGESAEGITIDAAMSRIRGKAGTAVTLHVRHLGQDLSVDIRIVRGVIHIEPVKGVRLVDAEAKIGYIRLTQFSEGAAKKFRAAVQKLQDQGMRGLAVDLRFNGGGLLEEAVELADLFVDEGVIVSTRGRRAMDQKVYRGKHEGTLPRIPLTVLINQASASASEVFAGAIRDHELGTLIGEQTYGKASVQTVIPVKDLLTSERNGAGLKLTTAHYFTPRGTNINREPGKKEYGVKPDVLVEMTPAEEREVFSRRAEAPGPDGAAAAKPAPDKQLARAVEVLRRQLGLPVAAQEPDKSKKDPQRGEATTK
jgi:carboxyl-terminal processing protease